jgi:DNA-binding MarR family transcriptional regulator
VELAREEPLLQKDLASKLRLEKSTVSRLVKTLEGRRWVGRTRSPHDGRAMQPRLTEAGKQMALRIG